MASVDVKETVKFNGVEYEKVDRPAEKGDLLKIGEDRRRWITDGNFYEVTRIDSDGYAWFIDNDGDKFRVNKLDEKPEVWAPVNAGDDDIITVDGVQYRKVDRKVKAGDFLYAEKDGEYVTAGNLYGIDRVDSDGDAVYFDDDGDTSWFDTDGSYNDNDVLTLVERVSPQTCEGDARYREVKRKARVGERIRIVDRFDSESRYDNGAEFTVNRADSDGDVCVTDDDIFIVYDEYVVLEPVTETWSVGDKARIKRVYGPLNGFSARDIVEIISLKSGGAHDITVKKEGSALTGYTDIENLEPVLEEEGSGTRLKIGDYAKVVGHAGMTHCFKIGDIVQRTSKVGPSCNLPGYKRLTDGLVQYLKDVDVVPATDEEIAKAKRKASGLKPGDTVRLLSGGGEVPLYGFEDGQLYEVVAVGDVADSVHEEDGRISITNGNAWSKGYALPDQLEKVSADELVWAKIGRKVGEWKDGDIAEVVHDVNGHPVGTIGVMGAGGMLKANGKRYSHNKAKLICPVENRVDMTEEVSREIQVGDSVRIIGNGFHHHSIGEIGVVTEIDEDDKEIPYYIAVGGSSQWVPAKDIERV